MENSKQPELYYNNLKTIFWILFASQFIFLLICLLIVYTNEYHVSKVSEGIFVFLVPAVVVLSLGIGLLYFFQRLRKVKKEGDIVSKYRQYSVISIVRWATFEGSTLINIMALLVTGEIVYLFGAVVIMLLYFTTIPYKERIVTVLNLSPEEEKLLA